MAIPEETTSDRQSRKAHFVKLVVEYFLLFYSQKLQSQINSFYCKHETGFLLYKGSIFED